MKNLPSNYSIFEPSYGVDIPIEQIFLHYYDALPSRFNNGKKYNIEVSNYLLSNGFEKVCQYSVYYKRLDNNSLTVFYKNDKKHIMVQFKVSEEKKNTIADLNFYYNINFGELVDLIDLNEIKKYVVKTEKFGINLVKSESGFLETVEFDIAVPDINLNLNYGPNFIKIHDVIVKRLNTSKDKGIVLFHGIPGSGKSTYIKYLIKLIKDKEILFIPPTMAESISEPSFIPFLLEHRDSILIIEDAERVISDRNINGSPMGVSNILNLTDGILGDCLNIQVVATFNMTKEKIDHALLRKGRLIAEHKFGKLSVEDSNKLLKYLKKNKTVDEPTTLADIYNIDEDVYKSENKSQIGFTK